MNTQKKHQQIFQGTVIARASENTITVLVGRYVKQPKYGKYFTRSKKYMVHDENDQAHVGDTVLFTPCAPISKRKRFRLFEVKTSAAEPIEQSAQD